MSLNAPIATANSSSEASGPRTPISNAIPVVPPVSKPTYGFPSDELEPLKSVDPRANGSSNRIAALSPIGARPDRNTAKLVSEVPPPWSLGRRKSIAKPRHGTFAVHGSWAVRGRGRGRGRTPEPRSVKTVRKSIGCLREICLVLILEIRLNRSPGEFSFNSLRGCSSAGRAPGSHPGGQGFEPPQLHLARLGTSQVARPTLHAGAGVCFRAP